MFKSKYSLSAYLGLLLTFVVIGSVLNSEKYLLLASSEQTVESTVKKAESFNSDENYEASLELLLGAVNDKPENSVLRSLLKKTFVLHLQSQIADGYEKIATNKHDIEGYLSVSKAYNLIEDRFRAMEVLTAGVIENPSSVRLWLSIGLLELEQKRDAEAFSVFKEVINLDEKNAHAYNDIAFVQSRSDDPRLINLNEALGNAKKAVSLEPDNPNFIDTLAEILFKRGERREAVRLMRRAISLDPEEPFYQSQLARFERGDAENITRDASDLAK